MNRSFVTRRLRHFTLPVYAGALLALVGLAACHPGEISNIDETDVVYTGVDKTAPFGTWQNYAMPDTVYEIKDDESDEDKWNHALNDQIIADIARNMDARGYTRVDTSLIGSATPPDLVMTVYGVTAQNWLVFTWWRWYPGWGGWGGYRPGYPSSQAVQFTTGTLWMNLIDHAQTSDADSTLVVPWSGAINGVAEGATSEIRARLTRGIDQAFTQSPYLQSSR
jgi:hypothetical protein